MFGIFKRVARLEERIAELESLEEMMVDVIMLANIVNAASIKKMTGKPKKAAPKKKRGRPRKIVS